MTFLLKTPETKKFWDFFWGIFIFKKNKASFTYFCSKINSSFSPLSVRSRAKNKPDLDLLLNSYLSIGIKILHQNLMRLSLYWGTFLKYVNIYACWKMDFATLLLHYCIHWLKNACSKNYIQDKKWNNSWTFAITIFSMVFQYIWFRKLGHIDVPKTNIVFQGILYCKIALASFSILDHFLTPVNSN
jgi:hypothetical protein